MLCLMPLNHVKDNGAASSESANRALVHRQAQLHTLHKWLVV